MKKFLALILALVMVLSLVACGSKPADDGATSPNLCINRRIGLPWSKGIISCRASICAAS